MTTVGAAAKIPAIATVAEAAVAAAAVAVAMATPRRRILWGTMLCWNRALSLPTKHATTMRQRSWKKPPHPLTTRADHRRHDATVSTRQFYYCSSGNSSNSRSFFRTNSSSATRFDGGSKQGKELSLWQQAKPPLRFYHHDNRNNISHNLFEQHEREEQQRRKARQLLQQEHSFSIADLRLTHWLLRSFYHRMNRQAHALANAQASVASSSTAWSSSSPPLQWPSKQDAESITLALRLMERLMTEVIAIQQCRPASSGSGDEDDNVDIVAAVATKESTIQPNAATMIASALQSSVLLRPPFYIVPMCIHQWFQCAIATSKHSKARSRQGIPRHGVQPNAINGPDTANVPVLVAAAAPEHLLPPHDLVELLCGMAQTRRRHFTPSATMTTTTVVYHQQQQQQQQQKYNALHGFSVSFDRAPTWSKIIEAATVHMAKKPTTESAATSASTALSLLQRIQRHEEEESLAQVQQLALSTIGTSAAESSTWTRRRVTAPILDTVVYTQVLSVLAASSAKKHTTQPHVLVLADDAQEGRVAKHGRKSRQPSLDSSTMAMRPDTRLSHQLEHLFHCMRQSKHTSPDVVSYHVLLRYYASRCCRDDKVVLADGDSSSADDPNTSLASASTAVATAVEQLALTVRHMKDEGVALDSACIASLVYGYAQAGRLSWAEQALQDMPMDRSKSSFLKLVGESVMHILVAYRSAIQESASSVHQNDNADRSRSASRTELVRQAEAFYQTVLHQGIVNDTTKGRMHGVMMEIYIHAGCMDEAEAIFSQLRNPPPDVTKYTILINGYGIHNQPGRAMNLLYKVLQQEQQSLPSTSGWNASSVTHRSYQNRPVPLNVIVLTAVMNAWRKAGRLDQAWTVFRLMTEHPVCRQVWKIRPNQVTYETLLQCCLASIVSSTQNQIDVDGDDPTGSNENSVGQHAERVMDDMEQRYRAGEIACQPTKRLYRLAIHICERVGDWDRAAELSASMKAIAQSARSKQDDGPHASQTIVESL